MKFGLNVKKYANENPNSALKYFLDVAFDSNLNYVKFYQNLENYHMSPTQCLENHKQMFSEKWKSNYAAYDIDSKLGTYLQINPSLAAPSYMFKSCFETDRLLLTRFRYGSHSLLIEKGRFMNVPRCDRLCQCGNGIQNILHCFSVCSLTLPTLEKRYTNLKDIFEDEDMCDLLHRVCKKLKLPI